MMHRYFLAISCIFILINTHADIGIISGNQMLESVNKQIINTNTDELKTILDTDLNVVLIDVRTPFELAKLGTIKRG
ncbi:hypothetical protein [Isorropodon fossajaponicum symbiont]|uniref:hypothetical protein n=1 Tax=Isorropodon fossajaponicum symbiont TaxID=883811 RepID=UPI001CEC9DC2|nr:hypothetical protein [Isorropodon fossajaponicum symbiont]